MKCSYCFLFSLPSCSAKRGQVIVFERSHGVGYFAPSTPTHFEHTGTSPLSFHWLTSSSSAVATDSPAKRTGAAFPGRFSRPGIGESAEFDPCGQKVLRPISSSQLLYSLNLSCLANWIVANGKFCVVESA
ncbi:hypothetical protein TNIN_396031 [Trichonephila inaurata madagascariensis]|uniref:Uncharacterized protein n=1 Tax=Trichonephila inaurata madagascariensis TaxID=2747483 RepID=A0A8X6X922_9ARAC|nr:hypothetical protein TNIN_396031 [Trichonephila inaurata madagascariensis]